MLQALKCDPLDWPEDAFDQPVAPSSCGSLGASRECEQSHGSSVLCHIHESSDHMETFLDESVANHYQLHPSKWREKLRPSAQEEPLNYGIKLDAGHTSCTLQVRPDFLDGWDNCLDLEVAGPSRTSTPRTPLQFRARNCCDQRASQEHWWPSGKVVATCSDDGRWKRPTEPSPSGLASPIPPKGQISDDEQACDTQDDPVSSRLASPTPRSTRQCDDSQPSSARTPSNLLALPRHQIALSHSTRGPNMPDLRFPIPPEAQICDEAPPCVPAPVGVESSHAKETSKWIYPAFAHLLFLMPLLPLMLFVAALIYRMPFLVSGIRAGRGWFTIWTQFFFAVLEFPCVALCALTPWRLVFLIRDSPHTRTNLDCTWLVVFHAFSAIWDLVALLGFVVLSLLSPHRLCRKIFRVSLQKSYTLSCATVKHRCMGKPWHCDPFPRIPESASIVTAYHGTSSQNASAIRKFGFVPSQDGMLGPGVYLSRDISKAASYGDGSIVWLQVSIGAIVVISHKNHPDQRTWSSKGFDTAFVPAGNHVVASRREELCVADPANITVLGTLWVHTHFPQFLVLMQVYEAICDFALLLLMYRLVYVIRAMCKEGSTFRDVEETWNRQKQLLLNDLYTFLLCPCLVIFWLLLVYLCLRFFSVVMPA